MLYMNNVYEDMKHAFRTLGALTREQLYRYYYPACQDQKTIDYYINYLITERFLTEREIPNVGMVLFYSNAPMMTAHYVVKIILSFWVVANYGCKRVREFQTGRYPTLVKMVLNTNEIYDITIVSSREDAVLAYYNRREDLPQNVEDVIVHLAVTNSNQLSDYLSECGFDAWCKINREDYTLERQELK